MEKENNGATGGRTEGKIKRARRAGSRARRRASVVELAVLTPTPVVALRGSNEFRSSSFRSTNWNRQTGKTPPKSTFVRKAPGGKSGRRIGWTSVEYGKKTRTQTLKGKERGSLGMEKGHSDGTSWTTETKERGTGERERERRINSGDRDGDK